MDYPTMLAESDAICAALSDADDTLKRDVLGHAGNRWALSVVHILGVQGALRHAELARLISIFQRVEENQILTVEQHLISKDSTDLIWGVGRREEP